MPRPPGRDSDSTGSGRTATPRVEKAVNAPASSAGEVSTAPSTNGRRRVFRHRRGPARGSVAAVSSKPHQRRDPHERDVERRDQRLAHVDHARGSAGRGLAGDQGPEGRSIVSGSSSTREAGWSGAAPAAIVERLQQHQRLERRARLAARQAGPVEGVVRVLRVAADRGDHRAGGGVQRHQGGRQRAAAEAPVLAPQARRAAPPPPPPPAPGAAGRSPSGPRTRAPPRAASAPPPPPPRAPRRGSAGPAAAGARDA